MAAVHREKMETQSHELTASNLKKLSADYNSNWQLRSLIQAIPVVGGSLDVLLSGVGANYQYERIEHFVSELQTRLSRTEKILTIKDIQPSEPLYDYIMQVFDSVRRTRSTVKRQRFADMVARQVVRQTQWDEAEMAIGLLDSLSELEMEILVFAKAVKPCGAIGGLARAVTVAEKPWGSDEGKAPPKLQDHFPNVPIAVLRAACSELVARGLFHDEGIGRVGAGALEYFVITEFAEWFLAWIPDRAVSSELRRS